MRCLAIITGRKGEIVWSTDDELDVIWQLAHIGLLLCTVLNSEDPKHVYVTVFPQEHRVRTRHGPLSVSVYGDEDKPALVTYPDVALNRECLCCLYIYL